MRTTRKKTTAPIEDTTQVKQISKKDYINSVIKRKQKNKFLSDNQKEYYDILVNNQILNK